MDGRTVYDTWTDERTLRRHGDAQGLALWSTSHLMLSDTMSLRPDGSGPTLHGIGHLEESFAYLVPGDLSTRPIATPGWMSRHGPGHRARVARRGREDVRHRRQRVLAHGPHPLLVDFEGALQKVCDAFAELGA